jgi:hypothetical protein
MGSSVAGLRTVSVTARIQTRVLESAALAQAPDAVDHPREHRRDEEREDPEDLPGTGQCGRRLSKHVRDERDGQDDVDDREREYIG